MDISVSQVDVQDIVHPTKEEMMEAVQVTPHERGQEHIAKQSDAVPPDTGEIAEVIQLTLHEVQQLKERIAKLIVHTTVPPDQEEIAKVRQVVTKLSEFCRAS